jgi:hypothetical protein
MALISKVLLFMPICVFAFAQTGSAETLEQMLPALKQNESSVVTFEGDCVRREYNYTRWLENGKFATPTTTPELVAGSSIHFTQDMARGQDFHAVMKFHESDPSKTKNILEEVRNGATVKVLERDSAGELLEGAVQYPKNSVYFRSGEPLGLRCPAYLKIENGAVQGNYMGLSQLLAASTWSRVCDQRENIGKYACKRIALAVPNERSYLFYEVWLGEDINLNIVKSLAVEAGKAAWEGGWKKSFASQDEYISFLEKRPSALTVCSGYKKTENGIWLAENVKSYILHPANHMGIENPADCEKLVELKRLDPVTSDLEGVVITGYKTSRLDLGSLKLNAPVEPAVFEKELFPAGIRVNNCVQPKSADHSKPRK